MIKFLGMYVSFVKLHLQTQIEYRADFSIGIVGIFIQQIGNFLLLLGIFTQIPVIEGYSFNEVLLIYGYSQFVRGIDFLYNDFIWTQAFWGIQEGSFMKYMIRPINPIVQIIMDRFNLESMGVIVLGAGLFFYAKSQLGLEFSLWEWGALGLFTLSGLIIYFSIKLVCAAIAFWTVSSGEFMQLVYETGDFSRYPLDIYKHFFIKFFFTYILPFAIISYYPIVYFIRSPQETSQVLGFLIFDRNWLLVLSWGVALSLLAISLFVWNKGIRRYEATGT